MFSFCCGWPARLSNRRCSPQPTPRHRRNWPPAPLGDRPAGTLAGFGRPWIIGIVTAIITAAPGLAVGRRTGGVAQPIATRTEPAADPARSPAVPRAPSARPRRKGRDRLVAASSLKTGIRTRRPAGASPSQLVPDARRGGHRPASRDTDRRRFARPVSLCLGPFRAPE